MIFKISPHTKQKTTSPSNAEVKECPRLCLGIQINFHLCC